MPREIDCFDCGGTGIKKCQHESHWTNSESGCTDPDCVGGEIMCLKCDENGKIKLFTQTELNKAVQDERDWIIDLLFGVSNAYEAVKAIRARNK